MAAFQGIGTRNIPQGLPARLQRALVLVGIMVVFLDFTACKRDIAKEASDSDSNGYLCQKCGAKLYTDRSYFLTQICPKCHQEGLAEVVGYECPKDHHITIRPQNGGRGSPLCEQCQGPLSGMLLPREKTLKAWGATKISS